MKKEISNIVGAATLAWTANLMAAHPLVTEDTGTQGRGKYQLELQAERGRDSEEGVTETADSFAAVLSWGWHDQADLILTLPYERVKIEEDGVDTITEKGRGDVGVDAKWRFYEAGDVSLAVKAGLSFATGDEERGLGAGETNYSALMIASYESEPWALHAHVGYFSHRTDPETDERDHFWQVAVGGWRELGRFKLAADVSAESSVDPDNDEKAKLGTLGVIYSPNDDLDLDVGVRWGLSDVATDRTLLAGATWRF